MSRARLMGIALALVATAVRTLAAQDILADSTNAREQRAFVALQRAVAVHDLEAVASQFLYPFRVNRQGRNPELITTRQGLIKAYALILTPRVRRAIERQHPDSLFHNDQGSMVGDGEVWISTLCTDRERKHCRTGVSAVNVP